MIKTDSDKRIGMAGMWKYSLCKISHVLFVHWTTKNMGSSVTGQNVQKAVFSTILPEQDV